MSFSVLFYNLIHLTLRLSCGVKSIWQGNGQLQPVVRPYYTKLHRIGYSHVTTIWTTICFFSSANDKVLGIDFLFSSIIVLSERNPYFLSNVQQLTNDPPFGFGIRTSHSASAGDNENT